MKRKYRGRATDAAWAAYLATVERERDERRAELVEAIKREALRDARFDDFAIPADLTIPKFLRRRHYDAGDEYRLAWAEIEGFCE